MRQIQQLVHDGKRLFCPDHPERELEEGLSSAERGPFSVFCAAPVAPEGNCMNSAEWPSREHMLRDLREEKP